MSELFTRRRGNKLSSSDRVRLSRPAQKNEAYDDGGTASGTFVFDADAGMCSSINIVTTCGTARAGAVYGNPVRDSPGNSSLFSATPDASGFVPGVPNLFLQWSGPLTNAGTSASVLPWTSSFFSNQAKVRGRIRLSGRLDRS